MNPPRSVTELCQALVRIPSVNPDGDPGFEKTGEAEVASYVAGFLRHCGADVVLEEVLPNRPNVIGRMPSHPSADGKPKPRIMFGPHLDTVGVGGMTIDPFAAEVRDGKIWGRGACDTKGPMAAMLWALWELREEIPSLPVEVHFAGFMSEESDQHGSRHFAQQHGKDYAFALIAEPTDLKIVFKHKGCLWADIETFGIAVHGSRPELGENAIIKMAKLIKALDADFRAQLANAGDDEWLGRTTLSLGMIKGGSRPNITADHCQLTVDIRYNPAVRDQGGPLELLRAFVKQHDATAKVEPRGAMSPCLDTPSSNIFVQKLVKEGAALTGAPWFCDAAFLAEAGVPAIALGPGSIAQAHTKDEWIDVRELEMGAEFWMKWLQSL
ncbi:MAG: M20 family metallopeptidase [Verrucomicrobia bacterium]|nr:M20 family metallopeptidase [Verrucomicrobiota bacterium]